MISATIRASLFALSLFVVCTKISLGQTFVMDNTPVVTCTGTFVDSGGSSGQYSANESFSKTFTPAMAGSVLVFTFTTWDVETGGGCPFDSLTIYDGPDNQSPSLGEFCGSGAAPGTIVATNATGELTFEWISDAVVQMDGWEATIACTAGSVDDCSEALPLALGQTSGTLLGTPPDGGSSCDPVGGSDRWYEYMATANGTLLLETLPSGMDTVLSVHSGCPGTSGNELVCNDDTGGAITSSLSHPMLLGETVLVRIADVGNSSSTANYNLSAEFVLGDRCVDATDVSSGGAFFAQFAATIADGSSTSDCPTSMPGVEGTDVWFSHTASVAGILRVTIENSVDAAVSLHTSCPGTIVNEVACDGGDTSSGLTTTRAVTPGTTTMIRVAALCDDTVRSTFLATVELVPNPPVNDDCANAIVLPNGYQTVLWDNIGATTDGANSFGFCDYGASGTDFTHQDVWYQWTPDVSGCVYFSHLGLAGVDTRLAIYDQTGCPDDPASIVACSDDEVQPISSPFEAGLDLDVVAGETYLIRTGTFSDSTPTGVYQLLIAPGPLADANNTSGFPQSGAPGCQGSFAYVESCFGDGGDQMGCTACPCGNEATPGTVGGCLNSVGASAHLIATGLASVSVLDPNDLGFLMENGVPGGFAVLTSGQSIGPLNMANPCFGTGSGVQSNVLDGLRCAVGSTQRHGGRATDGAGEIGFTNNGWGGAFGPPAGLATQGGFVAGETRHYQAFYRDFADQVCLTEQNTTQAITVTFTP